MCLITFKYYISLLCWNLWRLRICWLKLIFWSSTYPLKLSYFRKRPRFCQDYFTIKNNYKRWIKYEKREIILRGLRLIWKCFIQKHGFITIAIYNSNPTQSRYCYIISDEAKHTEIHEIFFWWQRAVDLMRRRYSTATALCNLAFAFGVLATEAMASTWLA